MADAASVAAFHADDASIVAAQGATVHGRSDLDAHWKRCTGAVDWKLVTISLEAHDGIAWQRGRSILTRSSEGAPQVSEVGFALVWRRDHDGEWRIVLDPIR